MTFACGTTGLASKRQGWPLTSRLELAAFPTAVPCARLHTRLVLLEWALAQLVDDAELIVSELITNAIKAAADPIVLTLKTDRSVLRLEIWDTAPGRPQPRPHAIDADSGRGLEIVTMLSRQWGVHHPEYGGKTTWAMLPVAR